MTQEALRMALEALENGDVPTPENAGKNLDAITAIKEALAQPEQFCDANCVWTDHHPDCRLTQTQEPVAWKHPDKNVVFWEDTKEVDEYHGFKPTIPLYTHPQRSESSGKPSAWVGLTDEEKSKLWEISRAALPRYATYAILIEDKFKEKNT